MSVVWYDCGCGSARFGWSSGRTPKGTSLSQPISRYGSQKWVTLHLKTLKKHVAPVAQLDRAWDF